MMLKKLSSLILFFILVSGYSYSQWIEVPSSPAGFIRNIISVNDTLYSSHSNNGIYKSVDGSISWQQINNGLSTNESRQVYEIIMFNNSLFAATVDGIYKSTNNGNDWIKNSNGITIGPGALKEFCESIFEHNGNLFTGAWNGIYRSIDQAENWVITNVNGQGILAKNFTNHSGILFAARESINLPNGFKSTDSGLTWEALTTINFPSISFFSEFPKLWMGTIHGVWLSTDNGITWERRSDGLSPDPYNTSIIRVNGKLVTSLHFGGSGIFISEDEGMNWIDFGEGLPFLSNIEKLLIYDDIIFAATSDGLWQRDTSDIITSSELNNNSMQTFELFQNYPNPFNPTTRIKFTIPRSDNPLLGGARGGWVTLKVYDVLGNELATLANETKDAGSYEVEFDASNHTSGIYFYKLQTGDFVSVKKMMVLK